MAAAAGPINNTNKKVAFKSCSPFSNCVTEINNTQLDDVQDIHIIMPMYNLIEYSGVFLKTWRSLWQYNRDGPTLDINSNIIDFHVNKNNGILFKFKQQMTEQAGNGGTKDIETIFPLRYVSNFGRTLECH